MRKNGFTLIELLAVIVILAIIALIATPIILGIINDAKEESNERSVELYAAAVKNGIAAHQLTKGEVKAGTYTEETLPFDVDVDGNVICTSITISEDGKVSLEGCTVNGGTKTYSYGTDEESNNTQKTLCSLASDSPVQGTEVGAKYECDLGTSTEAQDVTFYILQEGSATDPVYLIKAGNYDDTKQTYCDQSGPNPNNNACNADGLKSKFEEIAGVWNSLDIEQIILPTSDQLYAVSMPTPGWLGNGGNYWTSTPFMDPGAVYYCMDTKQDAGSVGVMGVSDASSGVRPVITIPITELKY